MNLDLDARLTGAFLLGSVVVIGDFAASLLGVPVNATVFGGGVSLIGFSLGAGAIRGATKNGPKDDRQARAEEDAE